MGNTLYKIVKLKMRSDIEVNLGLPASVKVFVSNTDDECNFAVNWFKDSRSNELLANFILKKMERAYNEGYTDCIDEHECESV